MKPLPHKYEVSVTAGEEGPAEINSVGLSRHLSAPPMEFDGPGDLWSPETLTVAAVADCFVLTFRAIARVARFRWTRLLCRGEGAVDRSEGIVRFTSIRLNVEVTLPTGSDADRAVRLLEKSEKACVVGNSLRFAPTFHFDILIEDPAVPV